MGSMEGDPGCKPGGAGSLWQDTAVIALTPSKPVSSCDGGRGHRGRHPLTVVYVSTQDEPDPPALQCLQEACKEVPRAELSTLPFGTVALVGDTDTLDSFYNAGEERWRS